MPRSLTGRIVLVVTLPLIAAWLAMGLALTVILASLHADATKSSLADIGQTLIVRFRNAALDRELRAVAADVRDAVAGSGIEVHLAAEHPWVDCKGRSSNDSRVGRSGPDQIQALVPIPAPRPAGDRRRKSVGSAIAIPGQLFRRFGDGSGPVGETGAGHARPRAVSSGSGPSRRRWP